LISLPPTISHLVTGDSGIDGRTTTVIVWACVAKIEEAIPAQGKLEPLGAVKDVQAPVGGVESYLRR